MARPSKSAEVLKNERKSHRTKAEMALRKEAEQAVLTGIKMRERREVAETPVAHVEFLRVRNLMSKVQKNDALYESVINDYCEYLADIARYREMRSVLIAALGELKDAGAEPGERYRLLSQMYGRIMDCDKQMQTYHKKRFDIERENGFTLASAMRSIPKVPEKKSNPLLEALQDGAD